jgi:hypothetical protein
MVSAFACSETATVPQVAVGVCMPEYASVVKSDEALSYRIDYQLRC